LSQGGGRENTRLLFDAYLRQARLKIRFVFRTGIQIQFVHSEFFERFSNWPVFLKTRSRQSIVGGERRVGFVQRQDYPTKRKIV
ncbi:hypothetical protein, partial [uncultured Allobaculum sp.]|uniref:hypothetical protein n=1 Tax=uncultured Allobaculum sp. TaxID=1187017 RepID=UPI002592F431